ncbi:MAG: hypothetical protein WAK91_12910 [Candidatus Acidiferrales bacterium]|jgi:hypothetical protein
MTLGPLIFAGIAVALLFIGLGLLIRPLKAESALRPVSAINMESLSAKNFRHLSQIRRALTDEDRQFIDSRLPKGSADRLRLERRSALRKYLVGIGEDFAHLDRLAREVASLSPKVEHRQETERLFLEVRFRILYRIALFRLGTAGSLPFEAVAHLSGMVGGLSRQVESMMASLQTLAHERSAESPSQL